MSPVLPLVGLYASRPVPVPVPNLICVLAMSIAIFRAVGPVQNLLRIARNMPQGACQCEKVI